MTNPMINPQPNYSGVTIQIANPAVNVNPYNTNPIPKGIAVENGNYAACPQACYCEHVNMMPDSYRQVTNPSQAQKYNSENSGYQQAYPAEYYINNYNVSDDLKGQHGRYSGSRDDFGTYASKLNDSIPDRTSTIGEKEHAIDVKKKIMSHPDCPPEVKSELQEEIDTIEREIDAIKKEQQASSDIIGDVPNDEDKHYYIAGKDLSIAEDEENSYGRNRTVDPLAGISPYKDYAKMPKVKGPEDMTASKNIIGNLDERNAEIKEAKKNTKEQKIVALTDEYIMSLENYLNNPNDELRLMAAKEILTRLDEDKDRYDDAALNALLNKMLQDPSKLIRLAALSAFASQLASGNDYTVQLLQNIQSNPNADKEDALQAADILLKMSSGVEIKNVPASEVKREQYKMKPRKSA